MKQREAIKRIFAGMRADLDDYRSLRELLEAQFEAALQHRTEALTEIGERIIAVTSILEQRRKERQQLVASVLPQGTPLSMAAVADRLQGASRAAFESCWKALESAIRECKTLNMRNCRLLMDQYEIMQRVLNVQSDTYAPA
ncbi:MAG: flagellar export chaperone FlgN [Gammaproteobacteria bacterium]|nr:flagellar protein FlgN [Gammaproteobacteria bacterium]